MRAIHSSLPELLVYDARMRHVFDERLVYAIIGAFFDVYNYFGYGLLEALYVAALERELRSKLNVRREVWVPVAYKGEQIGVQRIDMLVEDRVIIEAKSTKDLSLTANRQLYNYLRATKLGTGVLLHFGPEARFYRVTNRCAPERVRPTRIIARDLGNAGDK